MAVRAAVAMAVVGLGTGLTMSEAAAVAGTLAIGSGEAATGERSEVEVVATVPDPGLGAWTIDITYDPEVVVHVSCSPEQGAVCNPEFSIDTVRIAGASATGLTGSTPLGAITFECSRDGTSALTLRPMVFQDATIGDPQPIDTTVTDGGIDCREEGHASEEPLPTGTPVAAPTSTPVAGPTRVPSPIPSGTPEAGEARKIDVSTDTDLRPGEQVILKVAIAQEDFAFATPRLEDHRSIITSPDDARWEIYFGPDGRTMLTLHVDAPNFDVGEYTPNQQQEIRRETIKLDWTVTLAPKDRARGDQDIEVRIDQRLPDGEPLPAGVEASFTFPFEFSIEEAGDPWYRTWRSAIPEAASDITVLASAVGALIALGGVLRGHRIAAWFKSRFGSSSE